MSYGVRGPGGLLAADTVQRLESEFGAADNPGKRGLFLQNYWRPLPGRRQQFPISPNMRAIIDYAVSAMMSALRYDNPGINVRLPSHINPPFRSVQFTFQQQITMGGLATATPVTVLFNGQDVVPEGVQGVINRIGFHVFPDDIDTNANLQNGRLTISKNSVPVPGYSSLRAGFTMQESITDGAGAQIEGANIPSSEVSVPIHLRPGDFLETLAGQAAIVATDYDAIITLQGWLYPIEVEADGIFGTMADRGGR